ncbi:serine hydrolase [Kordia sp. YSTF-M3]|uniref:Serine hydrolase n=1 Tax=Kordia aestuariivivens TaxID=2759037 RepID=A0ABR7QGJ6_9FLAO|nr:serine hydrolase [Kordia aestuariivivens]MBC8757676.1 serine hydrolase [Kordia aestuariivivens]
MKNLLVLLLLLFFSCAKEENNPILFALNADSEKIQSVINNLEAHEIQIRVTDATGKDFSFRVNDSVYFYPASSVKFPIALFALEKANEIPEIDSETKFVIAEDSIQTNIQKEVQKIFAVSDNEAYNRLFEFLGQDEINKRLRAKGLEKAIIRHRLSTENADDLQTKAMLFLKNDDIVYDQKAKKNQEIENLRILNAQKGKGFYRNDSLIQKPMDFSQKNYLPINELHKLMQQLYFPDLYDETARFQLSKSDRDFVMKVMYETPKQQGFDTEEYYDSYVKFFMFGDTKKTMPKYIKIYNKVGYAYGFLTDSAYIVDELNDISFVITATIHVNENLIYNDDTYEYETIGIPFLAELGRQVHAFYLEKKQKDTTP